MAKDSYIDVSFDLMVALVGVLGLIGSIVFFIASFNSLLPEVMFFFALSSGLYGLFLITVSKRKIPSFMKKNQG